MHRLAFCAFWLSIFGADAGQDAGSAQAFAVQRTGPVDGGFALRYPGIARLWEETDPLPEEVEAGTPEWAFRLASRHGRRSQEMSCRSHKSIRGWPERADSQTGLIPRNLTFSGDIRNAEDAAAPEFLGRSRLTRRESVSVLPAPSPSRFVSGGFL